ncbi:unnamed protein product [Agarophyton chilense]|eukprot:gb/GEZJ01003326.1/.p2 GENE.gb/GEZJ01003326.1/~~gb/GEZJ01003326.1/.p2  ORF type:complete len:312 (+),score=35.70 gb/GEZJ01003326.1/:602-1537(+)
MHADPVEAMAPARQKSGLVVLPKDLTTCSPADAFSPSISIERINLPVNEDDNVVPLYIASDDKKVPMLVELVQFTHTHGSWISVPQDSALVPQFCSNGNLTFVTRVDPLFAILIVMDYNSKSTMTEVFQPLDALCTTGDGINLSSFSSEQQVSVICDSKMAGGESFHRLNKEKTVSWILHKHHLLSQHPQVDGQHAADILCQYLIERWVTIFQNARSLQKPARQMISATESPAEMAMTVMMNCAESNNIAASIPQSNEKRKSSQARNTTPSKKKKTVVNKRAAKWWASKRTPSNSIAVSPRKKTFRPSTTK